MPETGSNPLTANEENITVDAARAAIQAAILPITETLTVPIAEAVGRVLAADVVSSIDVPAHDNAAMDGYAFDGATLVGAETLTLSAVGTLLAGHAPGITVLTGECVRIMTGAVMPEGLDTVVPLELCRIDGDRVLIGAGAIRAGENRRRRGEDLAARSVALQAGRLLRPADIGLAASLGLVELEVMRRLRVAVFSTGDEVVSPGQPLPPHCIYDSNRYALIAALQRLGMEAIDLGLVRDDPQSLGAALQEAVARADAVVTSGGVSAGDADYTRAVIERLGTISFWKVAMRPGRPFAFGALHGEGARSICLFGLPGNPVASLVTFYVFAREALLALAGARVEALPALQARTATFIRKRPGRTEFQRGHVSRAGDGQWEVRAAVPQGSGILRSMSEANALIVLPHDRTSVAAGESVDVWLFEGLT
jgi:molybdopterin molybdotransferase